MTNMNGRTILSLVRKMLTLVFLPAAFVCNPALAQEPPQQTTTEGTVQSVSRSTLVVRTEGARYRLFSIERDTIKPADIPLESAVSVLSYPSGDPTYRRAYMITIMRQAPAQAAVTTPDVVPPEVRNAEDAIKRAARKYQMGFRTGVALDPELIVIGVHAQVGPFFSKNLAFRPNVEFAWGEVTYMFSINPEMIYSVPVGSFGGRWDLYFGGGPGLNFVGRNLSRPTGVGDIGFSDFHFDAAVNILAGVRFRSGVFTEVKTSIYAEPAPVLRLLVGYNF